MAGALSQAVETGNVVKFKMQSVRQNGNAFLILKAQSLP